MTEEEEKSAVKGYEQKAEAILKDESRVNAIIGNVTAKIIEVTQNSQTLDGFIGRLKVISRMVRAYVGGRYTEVPWRSVVLMMAGLLYFLAPIDLIPDFIPALGLVDDISVIAFIYRSLGRDVENFLRWEKGHIQI